VHFLFIARDAGIASNSAWARISFMLCYVMLVPSTYYCQTTIIASFKRHLETLIYHQAYDASL